MRTLLAIAVALGLSVAAARAMPAETASALMILASAAPAIVRIRRLTARQLMDKLGIHSRETLKKLEKKPGFPQPVYDPGSPVRFFLEHEIDQYILLQAEARDRAKQPEQSYPAANASAEDDAARKAKRPAKASRARAKSAALADDHADEDDVDHAAEDHARSAVLDIGVVAARKEV